MKSYHIYFGKIRDFFATSFVPSSERVPWRAESWNTVESQYRYRYLHKSTAEETLIILVSWFRQHEHVKNSTCGRLFIDCLFWQILPSRFPRAPHIWKDCNSSSCPTFIYTPAISTNRVETGMDLLHFYALLRHREELKLKGKWREREGEVKK